MARLQNVIELFVVAGLILIGICSTGCEFIDENDAEWADDEAGFSQQTLILEGSPEAVGILGFLNAPTTTFDVLDIDARLDIRSARGLIHHRNGPDGEYGTWDDDPFGSIAEVDAVKWVGNGAFNRVLIFADSLGWVPRESELLGIYDGVPFTVDEAVVVLELVNTVSDVTLDVFVNRRAVNSIVAARPLDSVEQLAALRYVGTTALTDIRDMAGLK